MSEDKHSASKIIPLSGLFRFKLTTLLVLTLMIRSIFIQASGIDTIRHHIGELFGGGVIFYVDASGKHGLICSMSDLISTETVSLSRNRLESGMPDNMNQTSSFDEAKNARRVCEWYTNSDFGNGIFSDWFLPDINQLEILYKVRDTINNALGNYFKDKKYNLRKSLYWSSSHSYDDRMPGNFLYDFNFGNRVSLSKRVKGTYIRAIRAY